MRVRMRNGNYSYSGRRRRRRGAEGDDVRYSYSDESTAAVALFRRIPVDTGDGPWESTRRRGTARCVITSLSADSTCCAAQTPSLTPGSGHSPHVRRNPANSRKLTRWLMRRTMSADIVGLAHHCQEYKNCPDDNYGRRVSRETCVELLDRGWLPHAHHHGVDARALSWNEPGGLFQTFSVVRGDEGAELARQAILPELHAALMMAPSVPPGARNRKACMTWRMPFLCPKGGFIATCV